MPGGNISEYFQAYNIDCLTLSGMHELNDALPTNDPTRWNNRKYICLVYEGCYIDELYREFSRKVNCILLTYGPKFSVKEAAEHLNWPQKYLPSALLRKVSHHANGMCGSTIAASHENPQRSSLKATGQSFQSLRILVVEDNKINQKVMSHMLKRLGVGRFEIANNGLEAVDMESKTEYDVILMDMEVSQDNLFLSSFGLLMFMLTED
jgi:hypothetical protein